MEDAVQLNLLGFPDKDGAAGSRLRAEATVGLPFVSKDGKTYRSGSSPASASRTGGR
jgi:hypothetical protein